MLDEVQDAIFWLRSQGKIGNEQIMPYIAQRKYAYGIKLVCRKSPPNVVKWVEENVQIGPNWVDGYAFTKADSDEVEPVEGFSYLEDYIEVTPGHQVYVYGGQGVADTCDLFIEYDQDKTFVDWWAWIGVNDSAATYSLGRKVSLSDRAHYIRMSANSSFKDRIVVYDDTAKAYLMLDGRICSVPIQSELKWHKKSGLYTNGMSMSAESAQYTETYIPFIGGHDITFYGGSSIPDAGYLIEYAEDKSYVDYWRYNANPRTVTTDSRSRWLRLTAHILADSEAYIYDETDQRWIMKDNKIC